MVHPGGTLKARFRYWFDNTMSRGTPALIGLLGLATVAVLVIVSLYLLAVGDRVDLNGDPRTVWQMLWESLVAVLGFYFAPVAGRWQILLGWLVLGIGGLFITSAFIGVLSTGLTSKLDDLRRGRSHVEEEGHTVLLGWSDQVFMVLGELAEATNGKRRAAAVLAVQDKAEMEDTIHGRLPKSRMHVACRTGNPIDPGDLDLVNPSKANAILIINDPEDPDSDILTIKTLLALGDVNQAPVIACVQQCQFSSFYGSVGCL